MLLITLIVIVAITAISIITVNAVNQNWGFYEISTAIGVAFVIIGGIGVVLTFSGGTQAGNVNIHAMAPELAMAEADYARSRRNAFPIVSFGLILIGIIFLVIGLVGVL